MQLYNHFNPFKSFNLFKAFSFLTPSVLQTFSILLIPFLILSSLKIETISIILVLPSFLPLYIFYHQLIKLILFILQRPSAKELMRHPFIKKAKKNSYLMDLIDRHRKWKLTRGDESESDSGGESGSEATEDSDTDWIMTVKGNPLEMMRGMEGVGSDPISPPSYDSLGYSEPVNSVNNKVNKICFFISKSISYIFDLSCL